MKMVCHGSINGCKSKCELSEPHEAAECCPGSLCDWNQSTYCVPEGTAPDTGDKGEESRHRYRQHARPTDYMDVNERDEVKA